MRERDDGGSDALGGIGGAMGRKAARATGKTRAPAALLKDFLGKIVVVDLKGEFVCLGMLQRVDDNFLELRDADLHDLRDSDTSRENYVAASRQTGVKRNRKRMLLVRAEVVALALLDDVTDE